MDNWITRINTIAATSSAPPLPAPATSQRGFQRPVLPMSRSSETLEEQVARYRAQLRQLRDQLSVHQSEERAAKSQGKRSWQQWETKQEYLEFELQRVATYFDILNAMHKTSDALTLRRLRSSARRDHDIRQLTAETQGETRCMPCMSIWA
ncbi:hypothetical protein PTSG_07715 [Salpingoeca rosetta]|uniref:PH domain-containing protein n=1 Tax=Salpingoeca rosetta (strain ATCC 50818 / BSB-021) TaxID=946362 RepID=F2UHJ9_SALR5|nr:uncharacterized protein PTSG_07715 [Salpingoeca rosetta]EGD76598.1 hypothetical protein PTSG_07715 [Salpingoeca rosetta]|eukprot:XP_004991512.1 hypothetical protein PTSG_07715 [Salpingoeca rosetta]